MREFSQGWCWWKRLSHKIPWNADHTTEMRNALRHSSTSRRRKRRKRGASSAVAAVPAVSGQGNVAASCNARRCMDATRNHASTQRSKARNAASATKTSSPPKSQPRLGQHHAVPGRPNRGHHKQAIHGDENQARTGMLTHHPAQAALPHSDVPAKSAVREDERTGCAIALR